MKKKSQHENPAIDEADDNDDAQAQQPQGGDSSGLRNLQLELQFLRDRFLNIDQKISGFLEQKSSQNDSESPSVDLIGEKVDVLREEFSQVNSTLKLLVSSASTNDQAESIRRIVENLKKHHEIVDKRLANISNINKHVSNAVLEGFESQTTATNQNALEFREILERICGHVEPAEEFKEIEPDSYDEIPDDEIPADQLVWMKTIFGADLAENEQIASRLSELQCSLLDGKDTVVSLIGHMMVFRSAAPERRPQLLKDLGEAFYRCCPRTSNVEDTLEQALAASLVRSCEKAGFSNKIEFVQVGERFDSTRHSSTGPGGTEITQTHGWVVLRENGKVYTKGAVTVR